jgi:putative ABC transport system permease protein
VSHPPVKPPRYANALLRKLLRDDLFEEVTGDLHEKFQTHCRDHGSASARINYWYQVINYIRPFAFRKLKRSSPNQYDMLRNYFKVGFRNLGKYPGYSSINIGGLALGMATTIMIGLWVYDELSYDRYHTNFNDLAQVMQHQTANGIRQTGKSLPLPLEQVIRSDHGFDFKYISMGTWTGEHILTADDQTISKRGSYFQEDFPEMLRLKMLTGTQKGLKDPSSVLLSNSTSKALFGERDPLNQSIRIDNRYDVKVIGVYEDLPYNTTFHDLQFIGSWELYFTEPWVKNAASNWGDNSFQMFVQLNPHADIASVSDRISKSKYDHVDKGEQAFEPEVFLLPMSDWYLRSDFKDGRQTGGRIQTIWMVGSIGVFVLLLACINFMNLSTARSEKRAKEIGIRMTIGSRRRQLINQFLSESFLVVSVAFVIALSIVLLSLPWFNELADKQIKITWSKPVFWLICVGFIITTTLIAGSYPALYLSSFQPVSVLKSMFKSVRLTSLPRKVLVVVQFAVSVTLIIGTIVVYQQIQYTKDRSLGYDQERLVTIQRKSDDLYGKFETLRAALKNVDAVVEASGSSSPLTAVWSNNGGFDWSGKDPALQSDFATTWVTHEYGKTLSWTVKEGRDFSRDFPSDSNAVILNEAAVKFMGVSDPVGMELTWGPQKLHVIGVVSDVMTQSPYTPVKQAVYFLTSNNINWVNLRLNPDKSVSESIELTQSVFKKLIPNVPFDYKFVDEEFARKFSSETRIEKLAYVFAGLAILISCLGLFGLASFVAEQRTKEIGIRKVLGASVVNLWRMLSTEFVFLVMISCAVAVPTAWYFLNDWLSNFDYRIEISWEIFLMAVAGAMTITLVTVSIQTIRAAIADPVKNLKSE